MAAPQYTTVAQVRAFTGLTAVEADDPTVTALIQHWSVLSEEYCGQPFEERALTLLLDGNDSGTLFLNIAIRTITALRMNDAILDADAAVDTSIYIFSTDPRNPTIRIKQTSSQNMFVRVSLGGSDGRILFVDGQANQRVDGTFGWVDSTGPQAGVGAPLPVQNAIARLVAIQAVRPMALDPMQVLRTDISEEWTDGHRLIYNKRKGRSDLTIPDPIAASWLSRFRAPIRIGVAIGRG